jgi:hypothetical protein
LQEKAVMEVHYTSIEWIQATIQATAFSAASLPVTAQACVPPSP